MLRAALAAPGVTEVRALVRRPIGMSDPKLREITHNDYLDYRAVTHAFAGVDACFFCLGISVRQVPDEDEYRRIHHAFPMAAAAMLREQKPAAPFHYLSGASAGLESRWMWARVKAEAERDLMARFGAMCWRPVMIDGMPTSPLPALDVVVKPVLRVVFRRFRNLYVLNDDIGRAMLQATRQGLTNRIVENAELRDLADRWKGLGS